MGLLALIFVQGTNLEDLTSVKVGPLLILMGFVATTLSICDPVGALQREIIKGPKLFYHKDLNDVIRQRIFDQAIEKYFNPLYIFSINCSLEDIKKNVRDGDLGINKVAV